MSSAKIGRLASDADAVAVPFSLCLRIISKVIFCLMQSEIAGDVTTLPLVASSRAASVVSHADIDSLTGLWGWLMCFKIRLRDTELLETPKSANGGHSRSTHSLQQPAHTRQKLSTRLPQVAHPA